MAAPVTATAPSDPKPADPKPVAAVPASVDDDDDKDDDVIGIIENVKMDPNQKWYGSGGWLPGPVEIGIWRSKVIKQLDFTVPLHASVQALSDLIDNDPSINTLANKMINENKALVPKIAQIGSIKIMLYGINLIISTPIIYSDKNLIGIPLDGWFGGLDATLAGQTLFRYPSWNDCITGILKTYYDFLITQKSWPKKDNTWLDPSGIAAWGPLSLWVLPSPDPPYWDCWNNFFGRDINRDCRPIASKDDDNIVTSPNDGSLFRWRTAIKQRDVFWLKDMPYSLANIFGSKKTKIYTKFFKGGTIWQTFLNPFNYHCWWSPVSGKILTAEVIPGLYYSKLVLPDFTDFASAPYLSHVNARGIVIIDTKGYANIGLVCCIPIGMVEVSTIEYVIKAGQTINKGDKIGRFQFGGSTFVIIFENLQKYNKKITFEADHVVDSSNKTNPKAFPTDAPAPTLLNPPASIDVEVGSQIAVISDI